MIISLGNGSVWISPADVMKTLFEAGDAADPERTIIRELRLPRVILAALVGWGLGIAGTGFQGLFRNPLADPFVIGASSGASFGATIVIVFNLSFFNLVTPANAAFLGSILTVILAFSFAKTGKKDPPTVSLLLAGTAISSFLSAWVSFLLSLPGELLEEPEGGNLVLEVQVGHRFVEDEDLRLLTKRLGDHGALELAAGEMGENLFTVGPQSRLFDGSLDGGLVVVP